MGRGHGRSRRASSHQGSAGDKHASASSYSGRASWPIIEWSIKNELSKLGLPGSIVHHHIKRPASLPGTAATAAAPLSPTPVGSDGREGKTGDATGPVDISSFQSQLRALQEQLSSLQSSSQSGGDAEDEPTQDALAQFATQLSALSASFQSATAAPTPTTADGVLDSSSTLDSSTTLDAALQEAGDRYKKIKQLEQLVKAYRPEDYNAAKPALQRQLWNMANKQVYTHIVGVLGYKHRALILGVTKDDGLAAWDKLKLHHNNRTGSTQAKYHEDYTNMTFDTPQRVRNFIEYKQALEDCANSFHEASGERIDAKLTRSKYLALPERYSEVKTKLADLDFQRYRSQKPPLTLDEIESWITSWEERDDIKKQLQAATSTLIKSRRRGHANNTGKKDQACFQFQKGKCKRGDACPYKHELISKGDRGNRGGGKGKHPGPKKPWTKDIGPCHHCGGEHWNKDCPQKDNKGNARSAASKAPRADQEDSEADSEDDIDWKARYLEARAHVRAEKRNKATRAAASASAWGDKSKAKRRSDKRGHAHMRVPITHNELLSASHSENPEPHAHTSYGYAANPCYQHGLALGASTANQSDLWLIDSGSSYFYAGENHEFDGETRDSDHIVIPYDGVEMPAVHEGDIGPLRDVPAIKGASIGLASTGQLADQFGIATIFDSRHAYLIPVHELQHILDSATHVASRAGAGELYVTNSGTLTASLSELIGGDDASEPESEGGTSELSLSDSDYDSVDEYVALHTGRVHAYHDNHAMDNCYRLHCRLGHMSPNKMIKLYEQGVDFGLKVNLDQLKRFKDYWCSVCALSNITRFPYPKKSSHERCKTILGVIHTDTQGKHKPTSIRGYRYIQDYIDEATRWLWLSLMKKKDELPIATTKKEREMAIQARDSVQAPGPGHKGLRVLKYRTDNAGEVTSKQAQERMLRKLIANDRTVPGESNQLAIAERYQRTILDGVRVLMTDAKLHKRFWCYAAEYLCHIYNRTPNSSNPGNKTPYEMFYGKTPPKLGRLRVFGADCVVHLPVADRENKSKIDPAGVAGKYLGVPPNNAKGHLVWIPSKKGVFVRYSVHFQEDMLRVRGPLMDRSSLDADHLASLDVDLTDGSTDLENPAEMETDASDTPDGGSGSSDTSDVPPDTSGSDSDDDSGVSGTPDVPSDASDAVSGGDIRADVIPPVSPNIISEGTSDTRGDSATPRGSHADQHDHIADPSLPLSGSDDEDDDVPGLVSASSDSDDESDDEDDHYADLSDAPWSDGENHVDENDGWNQIYTTTGQNERMRDIAIANDVDLDDLILHNEMNGHLLKGSTRLRPGTQLWLPDDPFDYSQPPTPELALLAAPIELSNDEVDRELIGVLEICHHAIHDAALMCQQLDLNVKARRTYHEHVQRGYAAFLRARDAGWAHLVEKLKHIKARDVPTPKRYSEAIQGDFKEFWLEAIRKEIKNLTDHGTWVWRDLPKGRKPIDSTWSFKVKPNDRGLIDKFKARLCARGFREIYGIDYFETHAPVTTLVVFRMCIADAAEHGYFFSFFDISGAYLKSTLTEEIYMTPPDGVDVPDGKVALLLKSLYGLKQAGRSWFGELREILVDCLHFDQGESDHCLFIITLDLDSEHFIRLNVHVDDCCATYNDKETYSSFITALEDHLQQGTSGTSPILSVSDDDNVYLGITVDRLEDGAIKIHQSRYTEDILARFNHLDCNPASTPYLSGPTLSKADGPKDDKERHEMKNVPYRSLIGSLLHLARCTRPDISAAVCILAKYQSDPGPRHWQAGKKVLAYLAGTRNYGIIYGRDRSADGIPHGVCHGWSDSDWAGDLDKRYSRSGRVHYTFGGAVSWGSTLQTCNALSSCQAEYQAACEAAKESVWLIRVCKDLGYDDVSIAHHGLLTQKEYEGHLPLTIFEDNQGCIDLSKNPVHHKRSKHIENKYHFVRDKVLDGTIKLVKCHTDDNVSDIFTKPLSKAVYIRHRDKLVSA